MTDLIQRCEQADEGMQRELLVEAFVAVFGEMPKQGWAFTYKPEYVQWARLERSFLRKINAEAFVDAALMLVPEGWTWCVDEGPSQWIIHGTAKPAGRVYLYGPTNYEFATAPTPALALCAAALKAREASRG